MTLEEKVKAYKALREQIEELDCKRKALGQEILALMPEERSVMQVADYKVRRMVRFSFRTTLDEARHLGATKIEEMVDKKKLQELVNLGISVPRASELRYVQIYNLHKEETPA